MVAAPSDRRHDLAVGTSDVQRLPLANANWNVLYARFQIQVLPQAVSLPTRLARTALSRRAGPTWENGETQTRLPPFWCWCGAQAHTWERAASFYEHDAARASVEWRCDADV